MNRAFSNILKAPVNYTQAAVNRFTDLNKSQWTMIGKKGRERKREIKREIRKADIHNRFMFIRQSEAGYMPEADLMLEINIEIRRLEGVSKTTKAIKVSYLNRGAISVFLSKSSDVSELLKNYRNQLVKVVEVVNPIVINT